MEATERSLVLEHLSANRERVRAVAKALSAQQQEFRPAEGRWSVIDCLEHIVVVENHVLKTIQRVLEAPPEPAKQAEVRRKDRAVLELVPDRATRVNGPPSMLPQRRWPDFEELLRQFGTTRERSIQFASETEADLRSHFFPHPILGDLDCYQWLLLLATHCERHVRQMEEVLEAFSGQHSATAGN